MKNNIKKYWNSDKVVGEFTNTPVQEYWYDYFDSIPNKHKLKVLDMGCGGGRYTEMLCGMGFNVYAFDLHKKMVEATKERIKENGMMALVSEADMDSIPYQDASLDYILSNGLFHNSRTQENLEKALFETNRVLKLGGELCLNMFYDGKNNTGLKKSGNNIYITRDNTPVTLLHLNQLLNLLSEKGFEPILKIVTYPREMEVGTRDVMRGVFKKIS